MSERTLRRLAVMAGALVVWLVVAAVSDGGGGDAGPELDLVDLDPARVQGVNIRRGVDDVVSLSREGPEWRVAGWRADSVAVARFLDELTPDRAEVVARNPANHGRMGVAADSGTTVLVDVEGDVRTYHVGTEAGAYGTAFVRPATGDEVYRVRAALAAPLGRSVDDWRDRRMVALDTARVHVLEVERDGGTWRAERGDTAWVLAPATAGTTAVDAVRGVLAELADLRASGFLADGDSLAAATEAGVVRAMGPSGDPLAVIRVGGDGGERWATVSGDPTRYRLPGWRVERLLPDPVGGS